MLEYRNLLVFFQISTTSQHQNNNVTLHFYFIYLILLLYNYSCSHFSSIDSLLPYPPPPATFSPPHHPPLSLSLGPLYMFLDLTLPESSPLSLLGISDFFKHFILFYLYFNANQFVLLN